MAYLGALLREHRRLALAMAALALLLKALVPAGYMLAAGDRVLTVEICADPSGTRMTRQIIVPSDGTGHDMPAKDAKADGACAYSGLSMASLGGADPVLLAAAIAFILLLGLSPVALPRPARQAYLRPPLRGPPALA